MRNDLPFQFDLLQNAVERLNQPIVLLNVLRNCTALEKLDYSELEQLLHATETLLQKSQNEIQSRIDFMLSKGGKHA